MQNPNGTNIDFTLFDIIKNTGYSGKIANYRSQRPRYGSFRGIILPDFG